MMHLGSLVVASALLALSLAPHPASEGHPDSRHATAQEVSPPRSDSDVSHEKPSVPEEPAPDRPLDPAEERIQGGWDGFESDSKEPRWTLHFEGRSFRAAGPDQWYQGRIELRNGDPAEIDLQIEDCGCSFKGQTSNAIYRWDKDSILLDGPVPGDPRPVKFDAKRVQQLRLVRTKGK